MFPQAFKCKLCVLIRHATDGRTACLYTHRQAGSQTSAMTNTETAGEEGQKNAERLNNFKKKRGNSHRSEQKKKSEDKKITQVKQDKGWNRKKGKKTIKEK